MGNDKYTAIDFFCGGGGMTCGLRQAGIDVIAGVDLDKEAQSTYETNNPGSVFVLANIRNLQDDYFEKKFSVRRNDDNLVLIGCSPCQFYSIINTSKEKSKESKDLLLEFQRFVRYYNPGYVLVENVPGIITNKYSVLPEFLSFLENNNYIIKQDVIDMSYYGVPQTRRRFSLIASRVKSVSLPVKEEKQAILRDYIGESHGFPKINAGHKDKTDFNHTTAGLSSICLKRLMKTKTDGGSRLDWKDDEELQLKCFIGKDENFKDTFGRMWWNRPAPTITTKFFSISNGRFAHPEENRAISLREGAVLQTFPRNYIFKTSSIASTARLIGNAVPCEYARRLGEIIVNK